MNRLPLLLVSLALGWASCATAGGADFRLGIYQVAKHDADLEKTVLAAEPLLTENDILGYDWKTHTLRLSEEGRRKLPPDKAVGVHGKPFVIVADGKRCYRGAFWSSFSSVSCSDPVINVSNRSSRIRIERAYPNDRFAKGKDPRSDARIRKVFEETEKL